CKRCQAGRVNNNRAGRYRGSGREWSGSQARDKAGEVSRGPDQAGSATNRTETGTGMQVTRYRAQEKHTPRPRLQVWPSLKYTCINSFRCWLAAGLSL
ncbi:unnamed protein product, partial [Staurois parvus]